jgi:hypothetical protein
VRLRGLACTPCPCLCVTRKRHFEFFLSAGKPLEIAALGQLCPVLAQFLFDGQMYAWHTLHTSVAVAGEIKRPGKARQRQTGPDQT